MVDLNEAQKKIRGLESSYRTKGDQLVRDFFQPCLESCSAYKRAAGYFSSSALETWIALLERLGNEDITIDLLISPELQQSDIDAIRKALDGSQKKYYLEMAADRLIENLIENSDDISNRLELFSWLIANQKLRIKFAYPIHQEDSDLFHQKSGVFYFPWGDVIAFEGSANESYSGHKKNWEKIQVFRSWIPEDAARLENTKAEFDEYWSGQESSLLVIDLSEKSLSKLKAIANNTVNRPSQSRDKENSLWAHQDAAEKEFLDKKSGILEMATGTGKTKTALKILKTLLASSKVKQAIITTDGNDLLNQWYAEVINSPIRKEGLINKVFRQFYTHTDGQTFLMQSTQSVLVISRENLAQVIKRMSPEQLSQTMIIHDEIHGLGSPGMIESLAGTHSKFVYKLGLSATPEREYDKLGSDFIESELGPVIFSFGIEDAIKKGILVEFDYVPLAYSLSDDDRIRLRNVHAKASGRKEQGRPMSKEEIWRDLANVYKTAEFKPLVFKNYLRANPDTINNSIIFVANRDYGDKVIDVLAEFTHNYRTYYHEDNTSNLEQFSRGQIETLITCHKISQGIDIQRLKTVILFSSDRARLETIQRIGRCLRRDPNNPRKRALVVDFYRLDGEDVSADIQRKEWLEQLSKVQKEKQDD